MGGRHSFSKLTTTDCFSDIHVHFDDDYINEEEDVSHLSLNARQVFKLKQSWKGVRRKMKEAGIEMFVR